MVKGRSLLQWAGFLLVCVAVTFTCIEAQGEKEPAKAPESGRADRITIDTMAAFQALEMPAVAFFHDKHTEALQKEKKNCKTCHVTENNQLSLAFMRQQGTKPAEFKGIYHAGCIGCHQEMVAAGKKSGPLDGFCRDCHSAKPEITTVRLDAGMDKVLHYRHVASENITAGNAGKDNCGACHHVQDKQTKKLVYTKGQETTCRHCHLDAAKDGVKSLRQAAHLQCVLCHFDVSKQRTDGATPVGCAGCHGADGQTLVAKKNREFVAGLKNQEVPRLSRGQPDAALIAYAPKPAESKAAKLPTMNPVPFDHKGHEKYNDTCRVCHHASMQSCQECHTLLGSKTGNFVTFEQSMHLKSSQHSCRGCHTAKQEASNCVGCHHSIVEAGFPEKAACRQCHMQMPQGAAPGSVANLPGPQKSAMAESMLKSRMMNLGTYALEDIPDKVVIKELADKYEAVEMAHRKHVTSLVKGMQDSKLAAYFHGDPGTVCQGCHHNSPPAKNPPGCSSCHGLPHGKASFDAREADRPGLLAALHGQCMGCHKYMAVKPQATACTECHAEKKK